MTIETTPVVSESIIRKIQLLFNLASSKEGNEVEAAAALGKAQELLAKYNLDMATVEDTVVAGGTAAAKQEAKRDYAVAGKRAAVYEWQRKLVKALAEANFCWYQTVSRYETGSCGAKKVNTKRHQVLGRVENTTVVVLMTDYLYETIERLLPYPNRERLSKDATLWREGCVERLVARIQAKAADMKGGGVQDASTTGSALALRSVVQSEYVANYDFKYGAGAYARALARSAEHERQSNALAKTAALTVETPAQKRAREKAEAAQDRRNERYWDAYYRKEAAKEARKLTGAYRAGAVVGASINLDSQITPGKVPSRLK